MMGSNANSVFHYLLAKDISQFFVTGKLLSQRHMTDRFGRLWLPYIFRIKQILRKIKNLWFSFTKM